LLELAECGQQQRKSQLPKCPKKEEKLSRQRSDSFRALTVKEVINFFY